MNFKSFFNKNAPFFLAATISIVYFLFSLQYQGPAYLSDEIGYLTKAAQIAGHSVDAASSWHAGYSFLISPAFLFTNNPMLAWEIVLAINALLLGASMLLLYRLLQEMFPLQDSKAIAATVIFCALYPSWITMSGYSFSTPAFVFIFMLILFLLYRGPRSPLNVILYSALSGYLYWIHPTGLVVAASITLLSLVSSAVNKKQAYVYAAGIFVALGLVLFYALLVHPWLLDSMTPEGYAATTHYSDTSGALSSIGHLSFWKAVFMTSLGHIGYLLVSTFGIIVFSLGRAMPSTFKKGWLRIYFTKVVNSPSNRVVFTMVLSIIGIVAMGAFYFSYEAETPKRVDYWIYGRYSETVLLPMIGVGLLTKWRKRTLAMSLILISFIAFTLIFTINHFNTAFEDINLVNVPAFWPLTIISDVNILGWFVYGAAALLVVGFISLSWKKIIVVVCVPFFVMSIQTQRDWHQNIIAEYSRPSGMYDLIISNYSTGQCMGYDEEGATTSDRSERLDLYSFLLYSYRFERMPFEYWLKNCDGPYLTHFADQYVGKEGVKVIAREFETGLELIIKENQVKELKNASINNSGFYIDFESEACVVGGCFNQSAENLSKYMRTGHYSTGLLTTNGKEGYIFHGPYLSLGKGTYTVNIDMSIDTIGEDTRLEVLNNIRGNWELVYTERIKEKGSSHNIKLDYDADSIEIRLFVDRDTSLSVGGYTVKLE